MGWQKRGKGHNSLTGQGTAMGLKAGKVLAYATRFKLCRTCSYASREGKQVKQHDCRKNHNGSSKAMEPSVACELWNAPPKQNARFSTYVGDDDTTTLSLLTESLPYDVEKWSDIVHAKRSLTTRLYNLSSTCKYQNSFVPSQKVINYLAKCFSYCIAQNSDPDSLKKALKCVIPHAFEDHQQCSDSWCGYKKELKETLLNLFEEYATDVVVKKLVPFANLQRNESFNNTVSSKNPKTHFYRGSESNDFRVACAVAQKNIGYGSVKDIGSTWHRSWKKLHCTNQKVG